MALSSEHSIKPCYTDIVSYVIGHDRYDVDRPVLIDAIDPSKSISLNEARRMVQALVCGLKDHGVQPGDTICLHMFNHIMFPVLYLAIIGAGARFTASNPAYTATELAHHLKTSGASFIITEGPHLKSVHEAAESVGIACDRLFVHAERSDADDGNHFTIKTLMSYGRASWESFSDKSLATTTIACLNTTSGTTGFPKMAARSHLSIVAEHQAIQDTVKKPYTVRRLLTAPFFHGFAAPVAVLDPLRNGIPTYVMRKFDQRVFLGAIERFGITETAMPPPLIVRFLATPEKDRLPLKQLRMVWTGGAPLTSEIMVSAVSMFVPKVRIVQVWGMTESGWMTSFHWPDKDLTGSVGRLLATYEAKLVDDNGHDIRDPSQRGEIWIRSQINMLDYYNNTSATADILTKDNWLKTGDIATIASDGKIYIVDRKKELIKVRGWQLAPAELESRLLAHPEIDDAAVIGIPHPSEASEVPRAFVVRCPGSSIGADDVREYLLKSLARYKVAECEVCFRDSIPKNPSGKILKRVLRQEAEAEEA